jgi:hypothetical protein
MNERIRELINEATSFKEGLIEGKYDIEVFDKEKFAELIVKECAGFAEQKYGNWYQYHSPDDAPGITIKKHFGVEQ